MPIAGIYEMPRAVEIIQGARSRATMRDVQADILPHLQQLRDVTLQREAFDKDNAEFRRRAHFNAELQQRTAAAIRQDDFDFATNPDNIAEIEKANYTSNRLRMEKELGEVGQNLSIGELQRRLALRDGDINDAVMQQSMQSEKNFMRRIAPNMQAGEGFRGNFFSFTPIELGVGGVGSRSGLSPMQLANKFDDRLRSDGFNNSAFLVRDGHLIETQIADATDEFEDGILRFSIPVETGEQAAYLREARGVNMFEDVVHGRRFFWVPATQFAELGGIFDTDKDSDTWGQIRDNRFDRIISFDDYARGMMEGISGTRTNAEGVEERFTEFSRRQFAEPQRITLNKENFLHALSPDELRGIDAERRKGKRDELINMYMEQGRMIRLDGTESEAVARQRLRHHQELVAMFRRDEQAQDNTSGSDMGGSGIAESSGGRSSTGTREPAGIHTPRWGGILARQVRDTFDAALTRSVMTSGSIEDMNKTLNELRETENRLVEGGSTSANLGKIRTRIEQLERSIRATEANNTVIELNREIRDVEWELNALNSQINRMANKNLTGADREYQQTLIQKRDRANENYRALRARERELRGK